MCVCVCVFVNSYIGHNNSKIVGRNIAANTKNDSQLLLTVCSKQE